MNEFARDFRARAQRADADVAARKFFRRDAHRFLAEPGAAVLFRQGKAEDADLGELLDDFEGNVDVLEMPRVRMRDHLVEREAAHGVLDFGVNFIEPRIAERHRPGLRRDQRAEPRLDVFRTSLRDEIGN